MIRLIETLNYRCLKSVRQELGPFHVLVGPNASGKTTFLDTIAFLRDLVSDGVESAVGKRGDSLYDLTWGRRTERFDLAVDVVVPRSLFPATDGMPTEEYAVRYEVALGIDPKTKKAAILDEQIAITEDYSACHFSGYAPDSETILDPLAWNGWRRLLHARNTGEREVWRENRMRYVGRSAKGYEIVYRPTGTRSVLRELPEHEFPAVVWLEHLLTEHAHSVSLDNPALRSPSAPGQGTVLTKDGSNLPWVVHELQQKDSERFRRWVEHLQTALPSLSAVTTVERPEDRKRYIMLEYSDGMKIPSWALSDGTLRLMALTVIPYAEKEPGIWLVEEPENGVHPLNLETIMQSLSSVYDGQVMVTTHSPAILALAELNQILAFQNPGGEGACIVTGSQHPHLADWKGDPSIATLFASGVLE